MHPATVQAIGGMLGVIRQALVGIEAVISAEDQTRVASISQNRDEAQGSGEETRYLNEKEENLVAKMFGLTDGS